MALISVEGADFVSTYDLLRALSIFIPCTGRFIKPDMAPRTVAGPSSRQALPPRPNGSGPSRLPAQRRSKRPVEVLNNEEDEEDEEDLVPNGGELEMGEDEEDEDDDELDEDEDEEAFPELDSGSDDGDDEEDEADLEAAGQAEDDSDDELLDDEGTGSESGYNSSDIDALGEEDDDDNASIPSSSTSVQLSPSSSKDNLNLSTDEKLSKMIAKHSVKPDETLGTDDQISRAKEGQGKLVRSKLVKGGYRREYDDVEAGYGSESSTEDVSRCV